MNQAYTQYNDELKQQWQSLSLWSKAVAITVSGLLLVLGLFTSLFIFSTALVIALGLYIQTKLSQWFGRPKTNAQQIN